MTIEERALVGMYTRATEARELIRKNLRNLEFIKDDDNQVLHLLSQADNSLQALASALSMMVLEHTESSPVQSQGPSARSDT